MALGGRRCAMTEGLGSGESWVCVAVLLRRMFRSSLLTGHPTEIQYGEGHVYAGPFPSGSSQAAAPHGLALFDAHPHDDGRDVEAQGVGRCGMEQNVTSLPRLNLLRDSGTDAR